MADRAVEITGQLPATFEDPALVVPTLPAVDWPSLGRRFLEAWAIAEAERSRRRANTRAVLYYLEHGRGDEPFGELSKVAGALNVHRAIMRAAHVDEAHARPLAVDAHHGPDRWGYTATFVVYQGQRAVRWAGDTDPLGVLVGDVRAAP